MKGKPDSDFSWRSVRRHTFLVILGELLRRLIQWLLGLIAVPAYEPIFAHGTYVHDDFKTTWRTTNGMENGIW
jgi:hypothetical protein